MFGLGMFDVRWRMFGISFCIKFTFVLIWLALGFYLLNLDLGRLLVWSGVLLVTFFVHNLAHAIVGRMFGARMTVVIGAFGGTTGGYEGLKRWQRILHFAAGPLGSLALWAGVEAYRFHGNPFAWGGNTAVWILRSVVLARDLTLFIAFFNLLPIYPLDMGMIVREILEGLWKRRGLIVSLLISFLCAGGIATYVGVTYWEAIRQRNILATLFFGFDAWLALQSLMLLIKVIREPQAGATPTETVNELELSRSQADDLDNYRPFDGGRPDDVSKR
jgi:hypothetical protein